MENQMDNNKTKLVKKPNPQERNTAKIKSSHMGATDVLIKKINVIKK